MSTSPRPACGAVDDLRLVHDAHGETSQVVLVLGVEAGHFGGLAADEGAAGLHAAVGDAGDDLSRCGSGTFLPQAM